MVELLNLGLTQPEVAQAVGGTSSCRMKETSGALTWSGFDSNS